MHRELRYFDIYPKVLPAGSVSQITVRCRDRRFALPNGTAINVTVLPLTESLERVDGEKYPQHTAVFVQGGFSFRHRFDKEQEYAIVFNLNDTDRIRLSVYAVEADLYALTPLKGDFHVHTCYSDGWESPEAVAAYYRMAGYDFTVISDHYRYEGSLAATEFYRDTCIDLRIVRGEEVHAPGNHIHIVNFGGDYSVNALYKDEPVRYEAEVAAILAGLDADLPFANPRERYEYASCLWVYDQIRKANGLAIFAHPHWMPETYHVRDSMTRLQFQNKCFDAFELLGGISPKENNMQLAFYHTAGKNGYGDFPIVGSSDSHGAVREPFAASTINSGFINPYGFGDIYSVVLAEANEKDAIISAVKKGYCAVVECYGDEHPQTHARIQSRSQPWVHGSYRMVSYVLFLLSEYFPLHNELCFEEGRLMMELAAVAGGNDYGTSHTDENDSGASHADGNDPGTSHADGNEYHTIHTVNKIKAALKGLSGRTGALATKYGFVEPLSHNQHHHAEQQ